MDAFLVIRALYTTRLDVKFLQGLGWSLRLVSFGPEESARPRGTTSMLDPSQVIVDHFVVVFIQNLHT